MSDTYRLAPNASGDIIVTIEQVRALVKEARFTPIDIFDKESIDSWYSFETEYRARKAEEPPVEDKPEAKKSSFGAGNPYLDPATNPMIKDGDGPFDDGKPLEDRFNPAKNPFLKIDKLG